MMSNDGNPPPVTVEILPGGINDPAAWDPRPGPETAQLALPPHGRATIIEEALRTLRRCIPPNVPDGAQTGLVIGYVQSGKTISFTTLAALARDNGYRLIIAITGTSKNLFYQSRQRLIDDLRLVARPGFNPWRHISRPCVADNCHTSIQDTLAEWDDATVPPAERRTVLITVNKNHSRLRHLIDVLSRINLTKTPTIIIDDEGDQAGMNTQVNRGRRSPTYVRLLDLMGCLPHHSYLQYTATPQAPLLINIVDILSPSFAELLTPGEGYVGGADFFDPQARLVRVIPQQQIPPQNPPLNAPTPPTLLEAMRLFFVGVAVGLIRDQSVGRRSMMVHPSQRTDPHGLFIRWVNAARDEWGRIFDLPEGDPDRNDLLELFRKAYDDLAATTADLPTYEEVAARLRHAIRRTNVREVNARGGTTTQINWTETYSWILVGGQAMDRGFTVEGLTVTYMPRGLGVGNADTVQQRARFFGYKLRYLGLCRVFLGPIVSQALSAYVAHEEDVRREMIAFRETGLPLSDWRRQFFLDMSLRPTRDNVIDVAYNRFQLGNDWAYPQGPHAATDAVSFNRTLFAQFRGAHEFVPHDGLDLRQNSPRNQMLRAVPLMMVHSELLTRYRVSRLEDSQLFASVLRVIQSHLSSTPGAVCTVFLMGGGQKRRRGYENRQIKELFQGIQYANQGGQRVTTYPGDRRIKEDIGICVQMSYLDLSDRGDRNKLIAENVPHLAVWIPTDLGRDVLQQPQGG